jgi:SAM-dependent methyltransferase
MGKRGDDQHRYGRHYTPMEVAGVLAAFAVRNPTDLVFDPSCGDGRLLREVLRLKNTPNRPARIEEVFGIDRSTSAVETASREGFQAVCVDFFEIEPAAVLTSTLRLPARFDSIIGNPPYIRQEVMGSRDKRRIEKCVGRDMAVAPHIFWPKWSGRSDIYVYFFAHSARFLRPEGRLVFLTAGSWLDVGYGAALREFLLRNFVIVAIIESGVESFFADASINTVITVLERRPASANLTENPVRFVQLNTPLSEVLNLTTSGTAPAVEFARSIERVSSDVTYCTHRIRVVSQHELLKQMTPPEAHDGVARQAGWNAGWGKYLRAEEVFFRVLARGGGSLKHLSDMARVRFGVKTGANEFFYVERDDEAIASDSSKKPGALGPDRRPQQSAKVASMKRLNEVASVRRGLTTGANAFFYLRTPRHSAKTGRMGSPDGSHPHRGSPQSRKGRKGGAEVVEDASGQPHTIESRYLSPVVFSLKELPGVLLDQPETKRLLFNCDSSKRDLRGAGALAYIRAGEQAGYHLRPTCAARPQWYSVTRGMKPAPLIFPSKVGERWVVAINRARVFEDKKLYGIFPRSRVSALVLAALLNSTWARYYAEITCRQMTGAQAIADIDVSVAEAVVLPDPRQLSESMKRRLESALKAIALRPVGSVFKEVKRADRRRLDALVLAAIGFSSRPEREAVLDELYAAMVSLVQGRNAKCEMRSAK